YRHGNYGLSVSSDLRIAPGCENLHELGRRRTQGAEFGYLDSLPRWHAPNRSAPPRCVPNGGPGARKWPDTGEHNMARNLLPVLILLTLGGHANAGDFPKSGEAELVNYAMIHEFMVVDGAGAGAFGAGQYSGVVRNVAGSGPFDKAS